MQVTRVWQGRKLVFGGDRVSVGEDAKRSGDEAMMLVCA